MKQSSVVMILRHALGRANRQGSDSYVPVSGALIRSVLSEIEELKAEIFERADAHERTELEVWIEAGQADHNLGGQPLPIDAREDLIEMQCEGYGQPSFWEWRNALKAKVPRCPVCGMPPSEDHETCRRIVREHFRDMQRALREAGEP